MEETDFRPDTNVTKEKYMSDEIEYCRIVRWGIVAFCCGFIVYTWANVPGKPPPHPAFQVLDQASADIQKAISTHAWTRDRWNDKDFQIEALLHEKLADIARTRQAVALILAEPNAPAEQVHQCKTASSPGSSR